MKESSFQSFIGEFFTGKTLNILSFKERVYRDQSGVLKELISKYIPYIHSVSTSSSYFGYKLYAAISNKEDMISFLDALSYSPSDIEFVSNDKISGGLGLIIAGAMYAHLNEKENISDHDQKILNLLSDSKWRFKEGFKKGQKRFQDLKYFYEIDLLQEHKAS